MKKNDNKEQSNYKAEIFEYLDKLPACTKNIPDNPRTMSKDKFIEIVKQYIDEKGILNGYCVEFSNDYSKIKKWDTVLRTPAEKR
ncbi:hypothetical protein LCGC14_2525420 [marine sediment metagenome]|uniref:Uncharacterized protein n=1 Tax=marine sediment metagenome TaxID=412755 RepID=A0A0F9DND6_9ZZZZ